MVVRWAATSLVLCAMGVGCAEQQRAPESADLVLPAWVDNSQNQRPSSRVLLDEDGASHAGREANLNDREHKERRERQKAAAKSTLLGKDKDSKFFGGCGSMDSSAHADCSGGRLK